jgi:hypothetical protein
VLLNRYPSAPDPWLLALSPVRGVPKGTGMPPAAAPVDKAAAQGMRGMWLKVCVRQSLLCVLCSLSPTLTTASLLTVRSQGCEGGSSLL